MMYATGFSGARLLPCWKELAQLNFVSGLILWPHHQMPRLPSMSSDWEDDSAQVSFPSSKFGFLLALPKSFGEWIWMLEIAVTNRDFRRNSLAFEVSNRLSLFCWNIAMDWRKAWIFLGPKGNATHYWLQMVSRGNHPHWGPYFRLAIMINSIQIFG